MASGIICASIGFCTRPEQIIALRALTGLVGVGSILNIVVMGELVSEGAKEQGERVAAASIAVSQMLILQVLPGSALPPCVAS